MAKRVRTTKRDIAPASRDDFEAKRMAILRAAARAFTEQGYHQTSINELADKLGVAKPMLYYYADSKDDLLFRCGQVARGALLAAMAQAQAAHYKGAEKLELFFRMY